MKNLKNLPITDTNSYILECQEINYLIEHNPDLIIDEEVRVNVGYEYFGLVKISTVYYVITRRDILYAGLSLFNATQKLVTSVANYIHFKNYSQLAAPG